MGSMFSKDTSIVLTIHNQEPIIDKVIRGIINNMSVNAKQMVIVFDGCKDNTESIVRRELKECRIKPDFYHLPNVWETKANNFAFRKSTCPYIVTVQDDAEIQDLNFDQRLLKPFDVVDNLLGVTGRNAQDEKPDSRRLWPDD